MVWIPLSPSDMPSKAPVAMLCDQTKMGVKVEDAAEGIAKPV